MAIRIRKQDKKQFAISVELFNKHKKEETY